MKHPKWRIVHDRNAEAAGDPWCFLVQRQPPDGQWELVAADRTLARADTRLREIARTELDTQRVN